MATERNVVDFKIHNLTEEQFQELKTQGQIDPNAVYCTPDTTKERLDTLEENKQDKGDYATNTALSQKQDIATAVNHDNITNCITEIPHDIKLEWNKETISWYAWGSPKDGRVYTKSATPSVGDSTYDLQGTVKDTIVSVGTDEFTTTGAYSSREWFRESIHDTTTTTSTLTLKAGSKVYVPNGASVFDVVDTTVDKTITIANNGQRFIFINQNGSLQEWSASSCYSGTTAPTDVRYPMWYDTTNNIIESSSDYGSTWSGKFSLPIAIVTVSNGAISSIDQVFNGFGYIGSTVFVLPGVSVLKPNGYNSDGTLKNIKSTIHSVRTNTTYRPNTNGYLIYAPAGQAIQKSAAITNWYYDKNRNVVSTLKGDTNWMILGTYTTDGQDQITSFAPKTTFHAVDYNDTDVATTAWVRDLFEALYPVGSLYITSTNTTTCPLASIVKKSDGSNSTWALVSSGKALWTGTGSNGNTTIAAGLPNITGTIGVEQNLIGDNSTGAFSVSGSGSIFTHSTNKATDSTGINFSAQNSNSIYGQSTTVQPPAYVVNVWRRTA